MSVAVRPEKLREALNAKLGDALHALYEIRESEKPILNRHHDPDRYIVGFLHAARGMYPIIETFAEDQLRPAGFKKWLADWEKGLAQPELDMWQKIRNERISQEHGEGADLINVSIPITQGNMPAAPHNIALLRLAPYRNESSKGGVRFRVYPNRTASEICAEYLKLAQRFMDDFMRDHARLIP